MGGALGLELLMLWTIFNTYNPPAASVQLGTLLLLLLLLGLWYFICLLCGVRLVWVHLLLLCTSCLMFWSVLLSKWCPKSETNAATMTTVECCDTDYCGATSIIMICCGWRFGSEWRFLNNVEGTCKSRELFGQIVFFCRWEGYDYYDLLLTTLAIIFNKIFYSAIISWKWLWKHYEWMATTLKGREKAQQTQGYL